MEVNFTVTDNSNNSPIYMAEVQIVNAPGTILGIAGYTDIGGNIDINSSLLDNQNNNLLITAPGYDSQLIDPQDADIYGVNLVPQTALQSLIPQGLPALTNAVAQANNGSSSNAAAQTSTVVKKPAVNSQNSMLTYLILGGIALLALFGLKGKK